MGSLDGNVSYWVATAPETSFPAYQEEDLKVDVAVLGGGITGLTTAMLLKQAGASVAVVEAGRVACGVTGYTTAKVTSLHGLVYAKLTRTFGEPGARIYGQANQETITLIERLVQQLGLDCDFEHLPAFTYTEDPQRVPLIRQEVQVARQAGLPASFSTDIGLPFPVQGAVRFEDQAQFHPLRRPRRGDPRGRRPGVRTDPCPQHPPRLPLHGQDDPRQPAGQAWSWLPPTCPSTTRLACSPRPPRPAPMRWR